jgi:3-hydroxyisobutyrate dehydrogenase-like beta-hydroxyacid dehydrogenase
VDIGFIGLGAMGSAIATNLVNKSGHAITVWNRTAAKAESLVAAGAKLAKTPREAGAGKSIVFSMLADESALHAALSGDDGLLAGLPKGALHVSLSTIAVATADHVAALHHERGQRYVSAPVFGRPDAAAAGRLFIAAAGAAADLDEAEPVLAAIGQKVFRIGEKPSAANLVKLCGNFAILAAIETMAEAMALAEKGGVPKAKLLRGFDRHAVRRAGLPHLRQHPGRGALYPRRLQGAARLEGHATGRRGRRQEPRGHAAAEPGARPSAGDDRQGGRGHRLVRHRKDRRPQRRPLARRAKSRRWLHCCATALGPTRRDTWGGPVSEA